MTNFMHRTIVLLLLASAALRCIAAEDSSTGTPVGAAFAHFRSNAAATTKPEMDDIRIGPTRIDLVLIVDDGRMDYVLVETERDGDSATVVAGPKDAGADMVYRLRKEEGGWKVVDAQATEEP